MDGHEHSGFRGAWQHRPWRRLMVGWSLSMIGDLMCFVGLVVVLAGPGRGTTWLAVATAARISVYVVLAPFGGAIADRLPRRDLMVRLDVGRFVCFAAVTVGVLGWGAGSTLAVTAVVVLTLASAVLSVPYRAAAVAATPNVVDEDDLAAANAAESVAGLVCSFVGPALGGLVVATAGPAPAFAVNALTFLVSAVLVSGLGDLGGAATPPPDETEQPGLWSDVVDGVRVVRTSPGLAAVLTVNAVVLLGLGAERVLHVVIATERLGRGTSFVGAISAALGVGGLVVAPLTSRLAASRAAGAWLVGAAVAAGAGLAIIGSVHGVAPALAVLAVEGAALMVFEVIATTLLQRWCAEHLLGRVFGLAESMSATTEVIGVLAAPLLVHQLGVRVATASVGVLVAAGSLLTVRSLRRAMAADDAARRRVAERTSELARLGIFEGASPAALERLARAALVRRVPPGELVVAEGGPSDHLYLVRSGRFAASSVAAGELSVMGPGDWFGELGIVHQMPRTASVRALEAGELWSIDAATFLGAVTGRVLDPNGWFEQVRTTRLARTGVAVA